MVKNLSTALVFFEEKMVVHATKHPNVFWRPSSTWVEGERSTIIPYEGFRKGVNHHKIKVEILNT